MVDHSPTNREQPRAHPGSTPPASAADSRRFVKHADERIENHSASTAASATPTARWAPARGDELEQTAPSAAREKRADKTKRQRQAATALQGSSRAGQHQQDRR